MKVIDLRNYLSDVDDDAEIILAKDAEGNDFSPLGSFSLTTGIYTPESTWSGYFVGEAEIGDEDYQQPGDNAIKAVCFWPVN